MILDYSDFIYCAELNEALMSIIDNDPIDESVFTNVTNHFDKAVKKSYARNKYRNKRNAYSEDEHRKDIKKGMLTMGAMGVGALTLAGVAMARALRSDEKKLEVLQKKLTKARNIETIDTLRYEIAILKNKLAAKKEKLLQKSKK